MVRRKIEELENGKKLRAESSPLRDWCVLPDHMREALSACEGHAIEVIEEQPPKE